VKLTLIIFIFLLYLSVIFPISFIEKSYGITIKEIGNITDRYNKKINIISN
jgi:hypothetical protein